MNAIDALCAVMRACNKSTVNGRNGYRDLHILLEISRLKSDASAPAVAAILNVSPKQVRWSLTKLAEDGFVFYADEKGRSRNRNEARRPVLTATGEAVIASIARIGAAPAKIKPAAA